MANIKRISVTNDDIQNGRRTSATSCPIALACKRQLGVEYVGVTPIYIGIGKVDLKIPEKAAAFVDDFDAGRDVVPFEFDLDMDDHYGYKFTARLRADACMPE